MSKHRLELVPPIQDQPNTVTRALAGPVRTATQLVPAFVITEFIDAFAYDFDEKQYAAMAALLLLGTSLIQNVIEQARGRGFLK